MNESGFTKHFLDRVKLRFPESFFLRGDPREIQGITDWFILYYDRWAALEFKRHPRANVQANQEYYINLFNDMSFAAFVHPGNEEEVFYALEQAFTSRRRTRVS